MKRFLFSTVSTGALGTVALLLRLMLAAIFIAHGSQKVLGAFGGNGLDATVHGMNEHMGVPLFFAYVAAFTEFLGGIGMLLGFLTRVWGMLLIIQMAVAILMVHLAGGFFNPKGFEFPLLILVVALCVTITGGGKMSVDSQIK